MVMYYHGTSTKNAFEIVITGALISPYEQQLREFRELGDPSVICRTFKGKNLEEVALGIVSNRYGKNEVEHRVKRVSLTKTFDKAKDYGINQGRRPGVVFGFNVPVERLKRKGILLYAWGKDETIFLPRVELDDLRELHWYGISQVQSEQLVKLAVAKSELMANGHYWADRTSFMARGRYRQRLKDELLKATEVAQKR